MAKQHPRNALTNTLLHLLSGALLQQLVCAWWWASQAARRARSSVHLLLYCLLRWQSDANMVEFTRATTILLLSTFITLQAGCRQVHTAFALLHLLFVSRSSVLGY